MLKTCEDEKDLRNALFIMNLYQRKKVPLSQQAASTFVGLCCRIGVPELALTALKHPTTPRSVKTQRSDNYVPSTDLAQWSRSQKPFATLMDAFGLKGDGVSVKHTFNLLQRLEVPHNYHAYHAAIRALAHCKMFPDALQLVEQARANVPVFNAAMETLCTSVAANAEAFENEVAAQEAETNDDDADTTNDEEQTDDGADEENPTEKE